MQKDAKPPEGTTAVSTEAFLNIALPVGIAAAGLIYALVMMWRDKQAAAREHKRLTRDLLTAYAEGRLSWSQIRCQTGVVDFGLVLQRLGEEGLRLPRADPNRPSAARLWLREALAERKRN